MSFGSYLFMIWEQLSSLSTKATDEFMVSRNLASAPQLSVLRVLMLVSQSNRFSLPENLVFPLFSQLIIV